MNNIKPADIILVDSGTNYGKAILITLNIFQDDDVKFIHVLMAVDKEKCIVAESKVKYHNIVEYLKSVKSYKIIRNNKLTDKQRLSIVKKAETLFGLRYGVLRIVLQFLDQIFRTNFFTVWLKDKKMHICSTLVSWSYYVVARVGFNGVQWQSVEPDDISDEQERNQHVWEVVSEK